MNKRGLILILNIRTFLMIISVSHKKILHLANTWDTEFNPKQALGPGIQLLVHLLVIIT